MKELLEKVFDAGQNYRAEMLKGIGSNTYPDFENWHSLLSPDLTLDAIDLYLEKIGEERINSDHYERLEESMRNFPG